MKSYKQVLQTCLGAKENISLIFCCLQTSFFSSNLLCNHGGCATRGTGLDIWIGIVS